MAVTITREQLRDAGAHFGHQTKRWHPKMKPYIYGEKNKYHIIDIDKTLVKLAEVKEVVSRVAAKGEKIIFVGTRKNSKPAVKEAAQRSNNFYVSTRWLGGTLTNMKTIQIRIKRLFDIENEEKTGKINLRGKKERIQIQKEKAKLENNLGGIKRMHKLPTLMVVTDPSIDEIAIKEARKLNIPVIGICDTNIDPDMVDFVIPANDDLHESINVIINYIVDVYCEAANIKPVPTRLKVVAQKREDVVKQQRYPNQFQQKTFKNVIGENTTTAKPVAETNTESDSEIKPVVETKTEDKPVVEAETVKKETVKKETAKKAVKTEDAEAEAKPKKAATKKAAKTDEGEAEAKPKKAATKKETVKKADKEVEAKPKKTTKKVKEEA